MRVVNIVPKDIYFLIEYRLDELKQIKLAMDKSKISINPLDADEKKAEEFFAKDFYNFICDCIEEVEKRDGA